MNFIEDLRHAHNMTLLSSIGPCDHKLNRCCCKKNQDQDASKGELVVVFSGDAKFKKFLSANWGQIIQPKNKIEVKRLLGSLDCPPLQRRARFFSQMEGLCFRGVGARAHENGLAETDSLSRSVFPGSIRFRHSGPAITSC